MFLFSVTHNPVWWELSDGNKTPKPIQTSTFSLGPTYFGWRVMEIGWWVMETHKSKQPLHLHFWNNHRLQPRNKSKGYYKPTMILAGYNFTWQLTRPMAITIIYHNHDHCQLSLCNSNLNYVIPIRLMKTKYSIRAWDFLFYLFSLSSFFHLELSSHTTTTLLILVNNF